MSIAVPTDLSSALSSADSREDAQTGIESIETGMRLLLALVSLGGQPQMLKTLAAAADMPPAKAHRYLVSLIRTGFIERDPAQGLYRFGPASLQLGVSALGSVDAIALSAEAMSRLRDEFDHTMALMVWGTYGPTIVRAEESVRMVTISFRVGRVLPVLTSAGGRALAAYLPLATTEPVIAKELQEARAAKRLSPKRITTMKQVEEMFREVRERGLARIAGDITPGVDAMAAPVLDARGTPVTALSAVGPRDAFDARWNGPLARALRSAAMTISKQLGYRA